MNQFADSLAHFANSKSHSSELVAAVSVKQIGAAEIAIFEQVQSLNHIAERIGNSFGDRNAHKNQDNESAAERDKQIANGSRNAFVTGFDCLVGIFIGLLLND